MPRLSCWFVKSALVYLLFGFVLGGFILAAKAGADGRVWAWLPAHGDALIVGWLVQFGMGVAYWIFPRFEGGGRGRATPAQLSFATLNLGLILGAWLPTVWLWFPEQTWLRAAMPYGLLLQALGAAMFALMLWRRAMTPPPVPPPAWKLRERSGGDNGAT